MKRLSVDWLLILPVLFLIGSSLVMLRSIAMNVFINQCIFSIASILIFVGIQYLDVWEIVRRSWTIYFFSLLILISLGFIGSASRGAVRWIDLGGYGVQISEFLKPFFALWLAQLALNKEKNLKTLLQMTALAFPIIFLVYRQPDLGSALMYLFAMLLFFMTIGFPLRYFAISIGGVALLSPVLWHFLHDYQRQRLENFLHLTNDPLGSSYNSIQAIIAIGSGQWWGRGIGVGTQSMLRFLPERHTDFMFATYAEATGFIGVTLVLLAIFLYLWRLYALIRVSHDTFTKYFLILTFGFLFVQSGVNIGMNSGILPIVGITLPFFSYGGSSLLTSAIFLGLATRLVSGEYKSVVEIR